MFAAAMDAVCVRHAACQPRDWPVCSVSAAALLQVQALVRELPGIVSCALGITLHLNHYCCLCYLWFPRMLCPWSRSVAAAAAVCGQPAVNPLAVVAPAVTDSTVSDMQLVLLLLFLFGSISEVKASKLNSMQLASNCGSLGDPFERHSVFVD